MNGKTLIKIGGGVVLAVTLSGIAMAHDAIRKMEEDPTRFTENEDESVNLVDFPILNIASFENKTTEISLDFSGQMQGVKGKVSVESRQTGAAHIKLQFERMMRAPVNKRFVLWALSSNGRYSKLGQIVNTGERQRAEIRSETYLREFDMFLTLEDTDVAVPTGPVFSAFGVKR